MPSRSESPAAIAVRDLDVGYGTFVVQRNLDFEVERGKVFIVMGGSGCGKSTVLRDDRPVPAAGRGSSAGRVSGRRTMTSASGSRHFGVL
jgi:ABC-type transporter Mla maintaining outer membrane lipid asymmetry ATPase subunit MlaF